MAARDSLRGPCDGYPVYGAVHEVVPSKELRCFLSNFEEVAFNHFDDTTQSIDMGGNLETNLEYEITRSDFDPRYHYKVFNSHGLGLSVLSMDPSASIAKRLRMKWEKHDFGAMIKEAQNELGRSVPGGKISAVFDSAILVGGRLPNCSDEKIRQKIALMPSAERSPDLYELVSKEAEICINAIRKRMKQFVYPWDITPHVTFAVFKRKAEPHKIAQLLKITNSMLAENPVGAALDPLSLRIKPMKGRRQKR